MPERSDIEAALRYLATRTHGLPVDLIQHAIARPRGTTGATLRYLTEPTTVLEGWTAAERAQALWRVINEGVIDPDVGPTRLSRRRRALHAALRLTDDDIREPWGSSLTERFKQLKALKGVFNEPTSTQPMEMAWKNAVQHLAVHLEERLRELRTPSDWGPYMSPVAVWPDAHEGQMEGPAENSEAPYVGLTFRRPSQGAQPVFVNLFITTVFMRRRAVYRRITERLVTARVDGVEYYLARGFTGKQENIKYVPVQALWGCTAEFIEPSHTGRPPVTRLWFPKPLRAGQQAHFASEVLDENITAQRDWIDVDIDHHGIDCGRLAYGGQFPVSGLTIRVRFDEGHLPEAVWWYAEANERERYDRPPAGDRHLLGVSGVDVQYTFTGQVCQPRESYGLAFSWRDRNSDC